MMTNNRLILKTLALVLLFTSCSVYKSGGRKNLESLGPPPGSIKTSSLHMLVVQPSEIDSLNVKSFEVCKLTNSDSTTCEQNLFCVESSDEAMMNHPDHDSAVAVDKNLLVDKATSQKTFERDLVCKLAQSSFN